MNDPERLLTSDVSEREQRLLRAGASEEPPADGAARLAAALGVAPASLGLLDASAKSATRAASQQPSANLGAATPAVGSAAKWIVLAGAGALALAGTALFIQRTPDARSPRPNTQVALDPAKTGTEGTTEAAAASRDQTASAPAVRAEEPAPQATASTHAVPSIADEIAQLERVRVLLGEADASGALALLAAYERDHAHGALREEAHFMRVQALALRGQHADARRHARSFERLYPKSVHSARVRSIAESLGAR